MDEILVFFRNARLHALKFHRNVYFVLLMVNNENVLSLQYFSARCGRLILPERFKEIAKQILFIELFSDKLNCLLTCFFQLQASFL